MDIPLNPPLVRFWWGLNQLLRNVSLPIGLGLMIGFVTQLILGRPLTWQPVFMAAWAGCFGFVLTGIGAMARRRRKARREILEDRLGVEDAMGRINTNACLILGGAFLGAALLICGGALGRVLGSLLRP